MKRKMNARKIMPLVLSVFMILGGCQITKTVPKEEQISRMTDDTICETLSGFTRADLAEAWGEPDYDLAFNGSLYNLDEKGTYLCVFYEEGTDKVTQAYLDTSGGIQNFTGTVEADYENSALVKIDDNGYWILRSGDQVTVGLDCEGERLNVDVGDKVYVEYFGGVMETMPLQLAHQLHISRIDRAGSLEDVDDALMEMGTMDGVSVELLDVTPTSATIGILDTSDKEVLYGEDYSLQVFKDNDWEAVPYVIENWGFHSIGYSPQKNIRTEWEADWEWLYGQLEPGQYRMVKSFMDFRGTGDYTEYHYFIEFEISEE